MGKSSRDESLHLEEKNQLVDDGKKAPLETEGKAGFFLSVFNLMNAILGSGILGLSYAMAQLGIVMFFVICGGVASLAFYAIVLMLNMCKKTGAKVRHVIARWRCWARKLRVSIPPSVGYHYL